MPKMTPAASDDPRFYVLPWQPETSENGGWYAIRNAVAVYKSRAAAEKFAAKDSTGTLVVRSEDFCR